MTKEEQIELAVNEFFTNNDLDEGRDEIRKTVQNLKEARYAVAHARGLSGYGSADIEYLMETILDL